MRAFITYYLSIPKLLVHHSRVKTVTNYIRYTRMAKHGIMYRLTKNIEHKYEVEHYRHMKKFTNIK